MPVAALRCIDLIRDDGTFTSGLVAVHPKNKTNQRLSIDEQAAVFDAQPFNRIDYIYFRRFSDDRASQIAAYVVDNCDEHMDEKALAELHRQLWLHGTAPILYIAWPTRIDVLTCARGPDFLDPKDQTNRFEPAESLLLQTAGAVDTELQKRVRLSALRLADGTFWEDPRNRRLANHDKSAHQALIQAVVEADRAIRGDKSPILRRLLLLMILIKYLEDRSVFPAGWFGKFHKGAKSFFDLLQTGDPNKVLRFLKCLEDKFNGDVFTLPIDGKKTLTVTALKRFARLVEARTLNRQRYFWEQFSFEYLPVEVISHLYQRFVSGGHGTVYTPPFLAALLLDHVMPFEKLTGNERVLDPACGSGIFLVGAFRRLVTVWRRQHDWQQRPSVNILKEILRQSIFGVELDPDAIHLTAFSLALAVCDALKPEVIWKELKLAPLRKTNLIREDFFQLILDSKENAETILDDRFDVIIGNPPFESKLTPPGASVNEAAVRNNSDRGLLPDKQAAYLFLEQSLKILRAGGLACLIQPSGFLYNQGVQTFRKQIFQRFKVNTVLDFTSIRHLYEADPKTIALSVRNRKPSTKHTINHLTFRRTLSTHQRIYFELDHYDRHRVTQRDAESDPFAWRMNLLGGGRLQGMSQRLRKMRSLAEYIREKEWDYGEGFIAAKTGKREPAPFLTGKPLLPTPAFTKSGIDETQIETVTETHFRSAYTKDRFSPPLVLIKKIDSLPHAYWNKGVLTYRNEIVGIHAPQTQRTMLKKFYQLFVSRHRTYQFFCMLHSTRSLICKATALRKRDLDMLPFPGHSDELKLSFWEDALKEDILEYMSDYIRTGQNAQLLKEEATRSNLKDYSNMFCRMLASVYEELHASDPIYLDGLICQPFYFGACPEVSWPDNRDNKELKKLVYHDQHAHLRTLRVLRFYSKNVMLIVKPNRLRYWIRSTAIRDADETIVDLHQQGY